MEDIECLERRPMLMSLKMFGGRMERLTRGRLYQVTSIEKRKLLKRLNGNNPCWRVPEAKKQGKKQKEFQETEVTEY